MKQPETSSLIPLQTRTHPHGCVRFIVCPYDLANFGWKVGCLACSSMVSAFSFFRPFPIFFIFFNTTHTDFRLLDRSLLYQINAFHSLLSSLAFYTAVQFYFFSWLSPLWFSMTLLVLSASIQSLVFYMVGWILSCSAYYSRYAICLFQIFPFLGSFHCDQFFFFLLACVCVCLAWF